MIDYRAAMPRIFILEDDDSLLAEVRRVAEFDRAKVESASSVSQAREQIKSAQFDLLILDWNLPDGSGVELCRELRASGQNVLSMPSENKYPT